MTDKTYDVHKSMHGDGRDYEPGDTRTLAEADAVELVELGALSLKGEPPKVREPAVRHTFGAAEQTGHLAMTIAGQEPAVIAPTVVEPAPAPTPTRRPRAGPLRRRRFLPLGDRRRSPFHQRDSRCRTHRRLSR
jgi:hypothetical protein